MHPIFRSKAHLAGYLAAWMGMAGLLGLLLRERLEWRESMMLAFPMCLFYAFVCLTPWYISRAPIGQRAWQIRMREVTAAIVACALWVAAARLIGQAMGADTRLKSELPPLAFVGGLLYSLSIAVHYVLAALESSREAALQARDAELRALKAQINPHFLFNSLNSITALTTVDPARAREMCIRLSDFLRNTLGLGERTSIQWREELQLARTYLEVEQVRFGTRLRVEMNVDEECSDCLIPPLVLQPLIENAVKHGIATLVDGGIIRVEGHVRNGRLEVSVENDFDPDSPSPRRHGLGLRNVRNRLATRFGSNGRLVAQAANNQFRAEMVVPCERE